MCRARSGISSGPGHIGRVVVRHELRDGTRLREEILEPIHRVDRVLDGRIGIGMREELPRSIIAEEVRRDCDRAGVERLCRLNVEGKVVGEEIDADGRERGDADLPLLNELDRQRGIRRRNAGEVRRPRGIRFLARELGKSPTSPRPRVHRHRGQAGIPTRYSTGFVRRPGWQPVSNCYRGCTAPCSRVRFPPSRTGRSPNRAGHSPPSPRCPRKWGPCWPRCRPGTWRSRRCILQGA